MTKRLQLYKCNVCGNMVTVVHPSGGTLSCCDQPMQFMEENTVDAAKEKHVPVIQKTDGGIKVTVGAVPHPMEPDHYIEWIEVVAGDRTCRQFLKPGVAPEAAFCLKGDGVVAREYCNKHGHWKS